MRVLAATGDTWGISGPVFSSSMPRWPSSPASSRSWLVAPWPAVTHQRRHQEPTWSTPIMSHTFTTGQN
jgi:hypothetical protein